MHTIVIVSNLSQSVSIPNVSTLVSVKDQIPCVCKPKPSGSLVDDANQNIWQLLHRLALEQTTTKL